MPTRTHLLWITSLRRRSVYREIEIGGDEWLFQVRMIGTDGKRPYFAYPRLLRSVGKAPAQYGDVKPWR